MEIKNIWDCSITIHASIKEKMNSILLEIAKERGTKKSKIIQELIETHPEYKKKMDELEKMEFFI